MLVPKKVDSKKISLYFLIIIIMFGATGVLLYKNYRMAFMVGSVPLYMDQLPLEQKNGGEITSTSSPTTFIPVVGNEEKVASSSPNDLSKISKFFDIGILQSEKFKVLENNFIAHLEKNNVGKPNPFKEQ